MVLVVAVTGALLALAPEVNALYLRGYDRVPAPGPTSLPASALARRAEAAVVRAAGALPPGTRRWLTRHREPDRTVVYTVAPPGAPARYELYVDPYRGEVLIVRDLAWDPLGVLLRAHRSLLLPETLGRPVVAVAVLLFVVSLLTGAVLWLPRRLRALRRRGAVRRRLTLDLRSGLVRAIDDLHRVLGAYALVVAAVLAVTGLAWSFGWVERGLAALAGDEGRAPVGAGGGSLLAVDAALAAADRAFPAAARFDVGLPAEPGGGLWVCASPEPAPGPRVDCLWFDPGSGARIGARLHRDRGLGERLQAMNHDVHVGRIAGVPGRLAAFLASLVAASLPVTGAVIWWSRRRSRGRAGPRLR